MPGHQYRVRVEEVDADGQILSEPKAFEFSAAIHDDLQQILGRLQGRFALNADETACMVLGLKLLGEVVMKQRKTEPFKALHPHIGSFIQALKSEAMVKLASD